MAKTKKKMKDKTPKDPELAEEQKKALVESLVSKPPESDAAPASNAPRQVTPAQAVLELAKGLQQVLGQVQARRKLAEEYESKPALNALAHVDGMLEPLVRAAVNLANALNPQPKGK